MSIIYKEEGREELAKLFKGVGVEIGVERGLYSEIIAQQASKLYAVDAWSVYHGYRDHAHQNKLNRFFEETKKRLAPYNAEIVRKFSMDAVKEFEDKSLDFVYIDANHDYVHVMEDIVEWSKKVKSGGIIAGHDYEVTHKHEDEKKGGYERQDVVRAVNDFTEKAGIDLIIYKGTKIPSWMFINP